MKLKLFLIWIILILGSNCFADTGFVQKVEIEPLSGGVSFNTVITNGISWVTCPTVEMRGRREILITNLSTTDNLYLTDISGSTATGIVFPKERASFKASANLHIFASGNTVQFEVWEIR
jgi:hypothetical protein